MAEATRDARSRQSRRARSALPARPSGRIGGEARAVSTRAAASARRTPPARGVWEGQLEQRTHSSRPFVCSPKRQYRTCVRILERLFCLSRGWDTRPKLKTVLGVDLAPQRPRYARERAEVANHILEPDWVGKRALARVGHGGPRFVGYGGEVDGPRELYDAIAARDARRSGLPSRRAQELEQRLRSRSHHGRLARRGKAQRREITEEDVVATKSVVIDHTQRDPWSVALEQFGIAADKLHLDPNMRAILAECQRELTVHFPVRMADGVVKVFSCYRVQHNTTRGPGKGGMRA